jgi:hypothetical protein
MRNIAICWTMPTSCGCDPSRTAASSSRESGGNPGDLIVPNTIGGVEGHFLRKLQAIAERADVVEPSGTGT